jgi:hypothetical protein
VPTAALAWLVAQLGARELVDARDPDTQARPAIKIIPNNPVVHAGASWAGGIVTVAG